MQETLAMRSQHAASRRCILSARLISLCRTTMEVILMTSITKEPGPGGGKPPIPDYALSLSVDAAQVYIGQPIPVTWSIKALHPKVPGGNVNVQAEIFDYNGVTATPLYTSPAPGPILVPGGSA